MFEPLKEYLRRKREHKEAVERMIKMADTPITKDVASENFEKCWCRHCRYGHYILNRKS